MELLVGFLLGAALGVAVAVVLRRRPAAEAVDPPGPPSEPATEADVMAAVFDALGSGAVVLGPDDTALLVNPAARALRVTRRDRLAVPALLRLVATARASGERADADVELPLGRERTAVHARAACASDRGHVLLLLEDMTEARRLEAVRRDFVANVSHELKTPVGALSLLAEAVLDAVDDPAAVRRFAQRMQHESHRLGRLVQELMDLSRVQGADPLPNPAVVEVSAVVREAADRSRLAAEAKAIHIVIGSTAGLRVWGDSGQLVTALSNLLDNAIAYSPEATRVAIGARDVGDTTEISVTDQGIGIAPDDLERIFERFYRADPARSRATGGTGLGLAIVKHIASNHGGKVTVWSVEGAGSTFTLHLPSLAADAAAAV